VTTANRKCAEPAAEQGREREPARLVYFDYLFFAIEKSDAFFLNETIRVRKHFRYQFLKKVFTIS